MRASLPFAWLLSAVAFLAAWFGLPSHWDSARIVAFAGTGVSLGGALLSALPKTWRYSILSALAVWHFGGIYCATTWPDPAPWTTVQVGTRMYQPYLMFMYLRNAYHFYSPQPGAANHLFALVKYDAIDPKTGRPEAKWVTLPNRDEHMKDPLGLSYFRRLSLTEQLSQAFPPMVQTFEQPEVVQRRQRAAGSLGGYSDYPKIPIAPAEIAPSASQYLVPRPDISRYLLPSYANHILITESTPGRKAVSVKLYRLEHVITQPYQFAIQKMNPHHPTSYRPYYLGEFGENPATGKVELLDPQDPLLYWLVPILPKIPPPDDPTDDFFDFMSVHAGYKYDWKDRQR